MSLLFTVVIIPTITAFSLISSQCKSVDIFSKPYLALDVCTNSYSEDYKGAYSQRYVCDEDRDFVNRSFYWGNDCQSLTNKPAFSVKVFGLHDDYCWNTTISRENSSRGSRAEVITSCSSYDYSFNCDESLPLCETANYTTYVPLPDEEVPDCTTDEEETNWNTRSIVINQCLCYNDSDNDTISCQNTFCNTTGIYEMWIDYFGDLAEDGIGFEDICDLSLDNVHEHDTEVSIYPMVEEECDILGRQHVVECPEDKCVSYYCIMAFVVSMVMVYMVQ